MGDYADATIELFNVHERTDELISLVAPLDLVDTDANGWLRYAIERLAYGADEQLCTTLQALQISYVFFQAGDHEHAAIARYFTPELGEWARPANAEGEPLIPAVAIDHLLAQMPLDADDVWLREALEVASGAPWRSYFAHLRAGVDAQRHGEPKQ